MSLIRGWLALCAVLCAVELPARAAPPTWDTIRLGGADAAGPCVARDGVIAFRGSIRTMGDTPVQSVHRLNVATRKEESSGGTLVNAPLFITRDAVIMRSPLGVDRQGIRDRHINLLERPGLLDMALHGDDEVYQLVDMTAAGGNGVELQMDHVGVPPVKDVVRTRMRVEHVATGVPRALFAGEGGDDRLAILVTQPRRQLDIYDLAEVRGRAHRPASAYNVQHVFLPGVNPDNPDPAVSVVLGDRQLFALVNGPRGHELHHLSPPFDATSVLHADARPFFRVSALQVDDAHIYYVLQRQPRGVEVVRVPRPRGDGKKPAPDVLLADDAGVSITLDHGRLYACSTTTGTIRRMRAR